MEIIRPRALRAGDRIAAVTLSWGGPAVFPDRYHVGKRQFCEAFDLELVEMPHTLRPADWLQRNPQARAEDLMAAFADHSIAGIVCTIGGDDSIRTLPCLDVDLIRRHPKPFIGYSDATVTHLACCRAGLVSFYGPTIMSGFAENGGLHDYLSESFRQTVMVGAKPRPLEPNREGWTDEFLDWGDPASQGISRKLRPAEEWHLLQGSGVNRGRLLGGCWEVFDWFRGTSWWPTSEVWEGAILMFETSEEAIPPVALERFLRTYATMGVLQQINGILFGRPGGRLDPDRFEEYDRAILKVVRDEVGLTELPIVTRMDFGHTDPILTLPLGVVAEIDCESPQISLLEAPVVD